MENIWDLFIETHDVNEIELLSQTLDKCIDVNHF